MFAAPWHRGHVQRCGWLLVTEFVFVWQENLLKQARTADKSAGGVGKLAACATIANDALW